MTIGKPRTAYLDQNVLSRLVDGGEFGEAVAQTLSLVRDTGLSFVCSSVHIEEIERDHRVSAFVDLLESLGVLFLAEASNLKNLEEGAWHSRIETEPTAISRVADALQGSLRLMNFIQGRENGVEAEELLSELVAEGEDVMRGLAADIPEEFAHLCAPWFDMKAVELGDVIRSVPIERLRAEAAPFLLEGNEKIQVRSQVQRLRPSEALAFLMSRQEERAQTEFEEMRRRVREMREPHTISSFAFAVFEMGFLADREMRGGDAKRRLQRYRAQLNDCRHIEMAAYCDVFLTLDQGAARLASAVFDYLGIGTSCAHLTKSQPQSA